MGPLRPDASPIRQPCRLNAVADVLCSSIHSLLGKPTGGEGSAISSLITILLRTATCAKSSLQNLVEQIKTRITLNKVFIKRVLGLNKMIAVPWFKKMNTLLHLDELRLVANFAALK